MILLKIAGKETVVANRSSYDLHTARMFLAKSIPYLVCGSLVAKVQVTVLKHTFR